jgi:Skp family chaperone for outer membrane proteins
MKVHGFIKKFGIFSTCLLLLVGIAGLSFAAEVKFGKISLADVRKNSAKIKTSLQNLQKTHAEALAKINDLKQETEKLLEKLKSQKESLKKEEREKLETELKDKEQELQAEQEAAKIKTTFLQKSIQNAAKGQINQAIEKVAKEEGISAVFLSEMLLYSDGIVDLTDKVTKALDSMPAFETGTQ